MNENISTRLLILTLFCLSAVALFGRFNYSPLDRGQERAVEGGCQVPIIMANFAGNVFVYSEHPIAFMPNENKLYLTKNLVGIVLTYAHLRQEPEKRDKGFWFLIALGVVSLLPLILIAKLQIIGYIGFVFYFLATGLGYLLSRKDKKKPLPKILFITAILGNLVGALFASIFKNLD